jgi:hypothetical protein
MSAPAKPTLDHIMYVAPDLDAAIEDLEEKTGVRAAYGGQHEGMGTHNALLGLGNGRYLEILAPIDANSAAAQPGGLLAEITTPRLFMWAVACDDIGAVTRHASQQGCDAGRVIDMSRKQPSGELLAWKLSVGGDDVAGSVVPFCIEWGNAPHPAKSAPAGCQLIELRARHPEPERIRKALAALQVDLAVAAGPEPALHLRIDTQKGELTLR